VGLGRTTVGVRTRLRRTEHADYHKFDSAPFDKRFGCVSSAKLNIWHLPRCAAEYLGFFDSVAIPHRRSIIRCMSGIPIADVRREYPSADGRDREVTSQAEARAIAPPMGTASKRGRAEIYSCVRCSVPNDSAKIAVQAAQFPGGVDGDHLVPFFAARRAHLLGRPLGGNGGTREALSVPALGWGLILRAAQTSPRCFRVSDLFAGLPACAARVVAWARAGGGFHNSGRVHFGAGALLDRSIVWCMLRVRSNRIGRSGGAAAAGSRGKQLLSRPRGRGPRR